MGLKNNSKPNSDSNLKEYPDPEEAKILEHIEKGQMYMDMRVMILQVSTLNQLTRAIGEDVFPDYVANHHCDQCSAQESVYILYKNLRKIYCVTCFKSGNRKDLNV